jgi:hypothetical protein
MFCYSFIQRRVAASLETLRREELRDRVAETLRSATNRFYLASAKWFYLAETLQRAPND